MAAIEEGKYSRALGDRLAELERQRDLLRARKAENPTAPIRLHPRLADVYAEKVQQLEEALNEPSIREEAAEVFRSLVDRVELRPRDKGQGLEALLYGDLVEILGFCGKDEKRKLPEAGAFRESTVGGCGDSQPPLFALPGGGSTGGRCRVSQGQIPVPHSFLELTATNRSLLARRITDMTRT